jgi:SAM-dependent methyltransferase
MPVDRWYIERYLAERAHLVHGHALEFREDLYASRFGADRVDVIDLSPDNPEATVVGDVCDATTLPSERFDVAVVTQTLQFVPRPLDAVRNLLDSLKPDGSLLLTVPTLSRIDDSWDRWRWTPSGLRDLLAETAASGVDVECTGLGNGLAARAFLFGLGAADLDEGVLSQHDADYPMIVGARVTRTG